MTLKIPTSANDGTNGAGSAARPSVMLSIIAPGLEFASSSATNIGRVGGYNIGAGSKQGGISIAGHLETRVARCLMSRIGYRTVRDKTITIAYVISAEYELYEI